MSFVNILCHILSTSALIVQSHDDHEVGALIVKKIQELNSRTEAPFPIFNSNIFHYGKSSNMGYNMVLGHSYDNSS